MRVGGGEEADFVGGVRTGLDKDVLAVAGAAYAEVEALVGFFVDEVRAAGREDGVFGEGVAEKLVLALGLLVFGGEEDGGGVGCPDEGADAFFCVGEVLASLQVAEAEGVLAEAGVIGRVGEHEAVGADGHSADRHEGLAFGELVDVEEDLFGGVEVLFAAVDGYCRPSTVRV